MGRWFACGESMGLAKGVRCEDDTTVWRLLFCCWICRRLKGREGLRIGSLDY